MKNFDENFDKELDAMIDKAAAKVNETDGEKLTNPDYEIEFSAEHEAKMKKLFRKEKDKSFWSTSFRAACIFGIVLIISSSLVMRVDAWRVSIMNFMLDLDSPNSSFNYNESEESSYNDNLVNFEYLPEGFSLVKRKSKENCTTMKFEKGEYYIIVEIDKISKNTYGSIDTENADYEKIKIKNNDAYFFEKENNRQIIWGTTSNYQCTVSGNVEKDELIKVAENFEIKV